MKNKNTSRVGLDDEPRLNYAIIYHFEYYILFINSLNCKKYYMNEVDFSI